MTVKKATTLRKKTTRKGTASTAGSVGKSESMASKVLKNIIGVCIGLLFLVLPLFVLNLTAQGAGLEKAYLLYVLVLIATVAWIGDMIVRKEIYVRKTPLDIPILIFVGISILLLLFSTDRYHSLYGAFGLPVQGVMHIIMLAITYFLVMTHVTAKTLFRNLLLVSISAAFSAVWFVLAVFNLLPSAVFRVIPGATFSSISAQATYFAMVMPILLSAVLFTLEASALKYRKVILGVLVVALFALFTSFLVLFSYTNWFILLLSIALYMILLASGYVKTSQKAIIVPSVVFFVVVIAMMAGRPLIPELALPTEASLSYVHSWDIVRSALADNSIFGTGAGTYGNVFSLHRPEVLTALYAPDLRFERGSGILFNVLSTTGIMGGIAFGAFAIYALFATLRVVVQNIRKIDMWGVGLFISALSYVVVIFMTKAYDSFYIVGAMILFMFFAYYYAVAKQGYRQITISEGVKSPKMLLLLGSLGVSVGLMACVSNVFFADLKVAKGTRILQEGDILKAHEVIEAGQKMNEKESQYLGLLAQSAIVQANQEAAKAEDERDEGVITEYLDQAVHYANIAVEKSPHSASVYATQGFVYEAGVGLKGDALQNARTAYENALEREPGNVLHDLALSRLKIAEAQLVLVEGGEEISEEEQKRAQQFIVEAQEIVGAGLEKKNQYAPLYDQLSITAEILGDIDTAIQASGAALQLDRGNFQYNFRLAGLLQSRGTEQDLAGAEQIFLSILGVNDQDITTRINLGILYERAGERDGAREAYEKAYELIEDKESEAAKSIKTLLDTVKDGGSNIITQPQADVQQPVEDVLSPESDVESEDGNVAQAELRVVVLDGGSGEPAVAQFVSNTLSPLGLNGVQQGSARQKNYSDITLYYGPNVESVENFEQVIAGSHGEEITSARNDEVVNGQNADVVIVLGGSMQLELAEEPQEEVEVQ